MIRSRDCLYCKQVCNISQDVIDWFRDQRCPLFSVVHTTEGTQDYFDKNELKHSKPNVILVYAAVVVGCRLLYAWQKSMNYCNFHTRKNTPMQHLRGAGDVALGCRHADEQEFISFTVVDTRYDSCAAIST